MPGSAPAAASLLSQVPPAMPGLEHPCCRAHTSGLCTPGWHWWGWRAQCSAHMGAAAPILPVPSPGWLSLQLHLGDAQTPVVLQFLGLDFLSWEKEISPRSDACGYRWDIYPSFSPVGAAGLPHSSQVPASSCRAPPCLGHCVGWRGLQLCPGLSLMSGTSLNLAALLRFAPFCVSANKYCSVLKITVQHEESSKAALGPEFPVQCLSQRGSWSRFSSAWAAHSFLPSWEEAMAAMCPRSVQDVSWCWGCAVLLVGFGAG